MQQTQHRFYTIVNTPYWSPLASGTQYSGPWVEVAEYLYKFTDALGLIANNETSVVNVFIKGFFGQNGSLTTAIEGVVYDTPIMGGDGGATHYYLSSYGTMRLSNLLDSHSLGVYVNCSDVGSATSTMLGMLGVQSVRLLRLG